MVACIFFFPAHGKSTYGQYFGQYERMKREFIGRKLAIQMAFCPEFASTWPQRSFTGFADKASCWAQIHCRPHDIYKRWRYHVFDFAAQS